jgi:hypothetical protein
MKPVGHMTPGELAAFVQATLEQQGIDVVLSGGMAVQIYSANQYTSRDLDLVPLTYGKRRVIKAAMQAIGFREEGRHFTHPATKLLVDFPPGPLTVGDEPVKKIREIRFSTGVLRLISPTDCVKDRLGWYYHMKDRQSLEQAVMVAQNQKIQLREIRRWSEHEGQLGEFQKIEGRLKRK